MQAIATRKRETYRGGACDPFLVHWPEGIAARGEVRTQYAHIIDMVPTVLDVLGIEPPATIRGVTQSPIHGVSFAYTFGDADAPTRHRTQYFEMFGHRAIDHDGWRAVCPWPGPSFAEAGKPFGVPITADDLTDLDVHRWELYHVAEDPAENHDLAEEHQDKLLELIARWYVEAGRYNVLPIDGSAFERFMAERPQVAEPRAGPGPLLAPVASRRISETMLPPALRISIWAGTCARSGARLSWTSGRRFRRAGQKKLLRGLLNGAVKGHPEHVDRASRP